MENPPGSEYEDNKTDFAYLRKIVTPSSVLQFDLDSLFHYGTARYYRMLWLKRIKEAYLKSVKVLKYSDDSTLSTGPALYSVYFKYAGLPPDPELGDPSMLKSSYLTHSHFSDIPSGVTTGEAKLTHLIFSADGDSTLAGYKKAYSFKYYEDSARYFDSLTSLGNFNSCYQDWARGGPRFTIYDSNMIKNQNNMSDYFRRWGGREYFGYYFYKPEVWSLKQLIIPEGLNFTYIYEPDKYKIGDNIWTGGGTRVKSILINDYAKTYPLPANDYPQIDTINYTYGNNDDGIGYATAMPPTYHKMTTKYKSSWTSYCGGVWSADIERFEGEVVDYEIQYPVVKKRLPQNGGTIENYYTTSDSVGGHKKYSVRYTDNVSGLCPSPPPINLTLYNLNIYHSTWQDRSPFLGRLYKGVQKDSSGTVVKSWQNFISWVPVKADTIVDDNCTCGIASQCTQFSVGDTIAASYFVRLDSSVELTDGVTKTSKYSYDSMYRMARVVEKENDFYRSRNLKYASSFYPAVRSRHYLSLLKSVSEQLLTYSLQDSTLQNYTDYEYRSDLLGQNLSGQNKIWYPSRIKMWIDLNDNHQIDSAAGNNYEFLVTENVQMDKYGNVVQVIQPDGTKNGYIYGFSGLEAS
ncbi:MAG: hypothetical protein NTV06_01825, partial [candidate division Zixibacteria bacterium]|nr:hypothetical protein [candidate division Zixibacteria bacterium]